MKKYVNGELLDMTAEEITVRETEVKAWTAGQADRDMAALRMERNKRLVDTDYLAMSDQTLSSDMTTYRQALRDITDSATSLKDVIWPTKP